MKALGRSCGYESWIKGGKIRDREGAIRATALRFCPRRPLEQYSDGGQFIASDFHVIWDVELEKVLRLGEPSWGKYGLRHFGPHHCCDDDRETERSGNKFARILAGEKECSTAHPAI